MRNIILLMIIASGLVACSFGSSSSTPPPTPYLFSNLVINDIGTEDCVSNNAGFTFTCNSTSVLHLTITYASQPASYLVMPTILSKNIMLSTSGVCSTEPVLDYSCTIDVSAINAESGTTYDFVLNGSLGPESFIQVIYE